VTTFAFYESLFDEARSWLDLADETAGVILARGGANGDVLLARELRPVPEEAYQERGPRRLAIASSGYVPALRAAADADEIACFIHSHPRGAPVPSKLDDAVDEELRRLFPDRTGQPDYVSLIIGGDADSPSLSGRIYHGGGRVEQLDRFRVAGRRIRLFVSDGGQPSADFDRQVRAFGADGQLLLHGLRVGVVGAGGTGSAVVEQLIRLGVGSLLIADDDNVSRTNLTRIHQSTAADVDRPKVEVASRLAAQVATGTTVVERIGRVTEERVAREFAGCDVVFGCTDDHAGRAVLSRLAYWYLIPVIDMGVVIDSTAGAIRGIFGRVTVCGPGSPCLICRGIVDSIRMRDERLSPEEREIRVAEGYAPELGDPDPAVVAYTTLTASLAVSEWLNRLFGVGEPVDEMRVRIHDRDIRAIAGQPNAGHYCDGPTMWARGDDEPFLGQTW